MGSGGSNLGRRLQLGAQRLQAGLVASHYRRVEACNQRTGMRGTAL